MFATLNSLLNFLETAVTISFILIGLVCNLDAEKTINRQGFDGHR